MKRITLLLLMAGSLASCQSASSKTPNGTSQETIKHHGYTTTYDRKLHYPVLVEWWETKARCGCDNPIPRKDQFAPDPLDVNNTDLEKGYVQINKDQKEAGKKGYDRGHMCPAADNECLGEQALTECFYFSNMAPQTHSLNAGDWKTLETRTRDLSAGNDKHNIPPYDSIHVWCGSIGIAQTDGIINVPAKCWKVIYIKSTKTYEAYIFDNSFDKPAGLDHWKVSVSDVEKITGYRFK